MNKNKRRGTGYYDEWLWYSFLLENKQTKSSRVIFVVI